MVIKHLLNRMILQVAPILPEPEKSITVVEVFVISPSFTNSECQQEFSWEEIGIVGNDPRKFQQPT